MKFKNNKPKSNLKTKHIRHNIQLKPTTKIPTNNNSHLEQDPQHVEQIQNNNDQEEITWKEDIEQDQDQPRQQQRSASESIGRVEENQSQNQEIIEENEGEGEVEIEEEHVEQDLMAKNQRNLEQYQEEIGNRGVVYMSRIPPYMTPNFIRKLLQPYGVERIYLLPESQWARNNRIKHGGSKRICFRQGWIEFTDKKVAKVTAFTLNSQKMVHKKGSFYSEDVWNLKYLPKFKWHHLTQKLAHEERLKKQRLRLEMQQERKLQQHYTNQVHKSKLIGGIIKGKLAKGKNLKSSHGRSFGQTSTLKQEGDSQN